MTLQINVYRIAHQDLTTSPTMIQGHVRQHARLAHLLRLIHVRVCRLVLLAPLLIPVQEYVLLHALHPITHLIWLTSAWGRVRTDLFLLMLMLLMGVDVCLNAQHLCLVIMIRSNARQTVQHWLTLTQISPRIYVLPHAQLGSSHTISPLHAGETALLLAYSLIVQLVNACPIAQAHSASTPIQQQVLVWVYAPWAGMVIPNLGNVRHHVQVRVPVMCYRYHVHVYHNAHLPISHLYPNVYVYRTVVQVYMATQSPVNVQDAQQYV